MLIRKFVSVVFILCSAAGCGHKTFAASDSNKTPSFTDSTNIPKKPDRFLDKQPKLASAADCYNLHWATWPAQNDVTSLTGNIADENGIPTGITMSADDSFGTTPSIYNYSKLNGYPGVAPNTTVPKTTWGVGSGTTTMCFSKKVTNPVLLLSSLGSSAPQSARLDFSVPYVVLYDGGGMVYDSSTAITGTEGYAIIMFPGNFTCVTIRSTTPENYTNLTWGLRVAPFNINITNGANTCTSATLTASGGVTYHWNGGDTPNQATNTFHQNGIYLVTVTNANGCVTSASKEIVLNAGVIPVINAFTITQQTSQTVIDEPNKTITLKVPPGTNLTSLQPTVSIPGNTTIIPVSGAPVNFTNPVVYTVTNSCQQANYTVTIQIDNSIPIKDISACPADAVFLNGDAVTALPDKYEWQIKQGSTWVNATGINNKPDYNTTASTNLTGANVIFEYRRAMTLGSNTVYDSYYRLTLTPSTSQNEISVDRPMSCGNVTRTYFFLGNVPTGYFGYASYQWQTSVDGLNWHNEINASSQNWTISAAITNKLWIRRITKTGNCQAYSNILTIDYLPGPTSATVGPPVTLCNADFYTLTGNIPGVDETGTWSVNSTTGYNPFNASNIHNPHAQITGLPKNLQFDLIWTISKPTCDQISSASLHVTNGVTSVITDFSIAEQNSPAIIDQANHTITLTVSAQTDRTQLIPVIATNNGSLNPVSGFPQNFTNPAIYRLTDVCAFADYKVTVSSVVATILHACQTSTFNILVPGDSNTAGVYQWQIYQNGSWQNISTEASNSDYLAAYSAGVTNTTSIVNFRRKVINNGAGIYDSYSDVHFDPPLSNNQILADKQVICAAGSDAVSLIGNTPTGGSGDVTYQWRFSTDNFNWQNISNATQKDYSFRFNGTTAIYYSRFARSGGCDDISNVIRLDYIGPVTVAVAGSDQSGCGISQFTLAANAPKVTEVGTWSVISPANYNPFNATNLHDPQANITNLPFDINVLLKWSISEAECGQLSESVVTIRRAAKPMVTAGNDIMIDRGASVALNGVVSGGDFPYQWSPAAGLNDAHILNPIASPTETTIYTLTALNGAYCNAQASVKVIVNAELSVPNTITPNNDGINDEWAIKNIDDHKNATVQIFDRIGRQVFNSIGYSKKWDATYNGKKLPAAVYYYIIFLKDVKVKKTGWVTVIY